MYKIIDREIKYFLTNFWILYITYPFDYDDVTDESIVEYFVERKFNYFDKEAIKSLKEIYYIFQKFVRNYGLTNPPPHGSWYKFLYDVADMDMDTEEEAYEWVCEIAKIYAKKLRERGLITVEEESNLFSGPVIQLKEGDKWALKGYDIEP